MNKLEKILLVIIVVLIIIIIIAINRCLFFVESYKTATLATMKITERANKIEEAFNRSMENVKIEISQNSVTPTGATIIITDNNEIPYMWGENYSIEKKENGSWKKIGLLSEENFNEILYKTDENNQIKQNIDWSNFYGTLSNGTYRIIKHVYTSDSDLYFDSNEFEIK